ncbi:MAG: cytochrome c biogenesis protein DipZ [Acidobacteria bacterium]|nr:MAG: cytochrome c biogenesis protein DipZ [Acidobacteriota bacterium]
MLLLVLAFLGGVLTIFSPCILPVLPFVFARADRSFRRSTLPLLVGMAVTFAIFAALATAGGQWIVRTNEYGRVVALVIMAALGVSLFVPAVAEWFMRPLVRLGATLRARVQPSGEQASPAGSVVLGAAIGLLWAPCAGPILGLVLGVAALSGFSTWTLGLLLAFAVGAAVSLAIVMLAGQRVFQSLKRGLGAEAWLRRALGAVVLAAVVAIVFGADTQLLAAVQYVNTNGIEQRLVAVLAHPRPVRAAAAFTGAGPSAASPRVPLVLGAAGDPVRPSRASAPQVQQVKLDNEGPMPSLSGATGWLNSQRLTRKSLRGKVVLIDFWTYSCINCLRSLPYIEGWAQKYKSQGLVVIGVHSPEFAFERDLSNVRAAVGRLKLTFPIAVDSDHKIWNAFNNEYWPADYFVDANGNIRFHHFGEGQYGESERVIQELLAEAHHQQLANSGGFVGDSGNGAEAAADVRQIGSPETYIGYARGERFDSPERLRIDRTATYSAPLRPSLNQWGLKGTWHVGAESAMLEQANGEVIYRFHARDLHMVMGSGTGKPIRFRIWIDGTQPGPDHGVDTNAAGFGTVTGYRLYQLVRQRGDVEGRTFTIEFLDPGVKVFTFTFG